MKKANLGSIVLAALVLAGLAVEAKPLPAKLVMPGGKFWKGSVVGRDGDWIEFATGSAANPIRIGAGTIDELVFTLAIDEDLLERLQEERLYDQVISMLETELEPYGVYSDIPSNLTPYTALLMELYYKIGSYDKVLAIAEGLAADKRNPDLQRKSLVFLGMALIEGGRVGEAEALFAENGWTAELPNDAPPEDLFIVAKFLAAKKEYAKAMEMAAKVVAFHCQDPEWVQPAELLCAEVYAELGMFDSADEVIREISLLYKNSDEDVKARELKVRVDALRAEKKAQDLESDEV